MFAAAIVFALAYVFVVRQPPPVPVPSARALHGTYEWTRTFTDPSGGPAVTRTDRESGSFVAVASGDGSATCTASGPQSDAVQSRAEVTFDARSRTQTVTQAASPATTVREVGAWPPAWRLDAHTPLDYQGLAAVVRSAVEDRDRGIGIKPLEQGGRKVWRAALTLPGGWVVEAVVDQQSGIVTWYSSTGPGPSPESGTAGGSVHEEFTAKIDWAASQATASASPPASVPSSRPVTTVRERRFVYQPDLAAAAATLGFTPLEPTLMPDGYQLRAVATRYRSGTPESWLFGGAEELSAEPQTRRPNEVDLLYTRGLTWATVTIARLAGDGRASEGAKSLEGGLDGMLSHESGAVQYGALAGATAHTWLAAGGPMLFVSNGEWAVRASGSLTRQELLSLAEGLKPLR